MKTIYELFEKDEITKDLLDTIKVGCLVKCNEWKVPYKVMATSENYFIMVRKQFGKIYHSVCAKYPSPYSCNEFTKGNFRIGGLAWWGGMPDWDYESAEDMQKLLDGVEDKSNTYLRISDRHGTVDLNKILIKNI